MAEPRVVTIPGAPEGYNCRLSVGGYGSRVCRAVVIQYDLKVIGEDASAANRRAYYPVVVAGSSFDLQVIHKTYDEREAFNTWVRGYMEGIAANRRMSGAMKMECPARRLVRVGVVEGTLEYGLVWNETLSYATTLAFVGSSEPLSALGGESVEGVSYFKTARVDAATSATFYPTGSQVAGAESLEGTIFDTTPPVLDLTPIIKHPASSDRGLVL